MEYWGCLLTVVVLVVLTVGPIVLGIAVSPPAGVVAGLAALVTWCYLSPRPFRHTLHFLVLLLGFALISAAIIGCLVRWSAGA